MEGRQTLAHCGIRESLANGSPDCLRVSSGVAFGATNAIHPDMTKSLKPASVTVGKSGVLASL